MIDITLPEPIHGLLSGIEPRAITNFYGTPGSGKTNLCMLAAVDCVRKGGKVVYIDTEGGFSLERLKQIANSDFESILQGIELVEPKDLAEQTDIVRRIADRKPDLVILDSSVALYRIEYAQMNETVNDKSKKCEMNSVMSANRELSRQISILSMLSREMNIPVIITAHAFKSWDNGDYDVVGGDAIRYWSKSLIFLERTGKDSERKATIIKHRSQPEGKHAKFILTADGIKPHGFKIF